MTIRERVTNWADKYPQPDDVLQKALSRADVCDSCEHKKDEICGVCGCRLIRIAFRDMDNPCDLSKFNEPIVPKQRTLQ